MPIRNKQTQYANKGMDFESLLNTSNEMYLQKGIAAITKIPTPFIPQRTNGEITGAIVRQKSICDYIGVAKGTPIAMEAKSVKDRKGTIRADAVKEHQAKFLADWENNGGKSFVLVSFALDQFVLASWAWWKEWLYGEGKRSKHLEEFPKELTFGLGGRVPCDYLKHI